MEMLNIRWNNESKNIMLNQKRIYKGLGGDEGEWWRSEFKYDIFAIL
jgi:hypothetical protein